MEEKAGKRDSVTRFAVVSCHGFVPSLWGGKVSQGILAKSSVQRFYISK